MVRSLDNVLGRVVGDYMSGNSGHGGQKKERVKRRIPHEVGQEATAFYEKSFLEEVCDEEHHLETGKRHDRAHVEALKALDDRKELLTEEDFYNALTDIFDKYKQELGYAPTKKEHRDILKQDVRRYLRELNEQEGSELQGKVATYVRNRDVQKLLRELHEAEKTKAISAKPINKLYELVKEDQEPDYYMDLLRIIENNSGKRSSKGSLTKRASRDNVIKELIEHYSARMAEVMEDTRAEKTRSTYRNGHSHSGEHASH